MSKDFIVDTDWKGGVTRTTDTFATQAEAVAHAARMAYDSRVAFSGVRNMAKDANYKPTLRPASFSTLPQGVKWEYVEAPSDLNTRPDLPRSNNRYGVIKLDRKLTDEEKSRFGLVEV